jgi:histidinol phosphatase-like enzyme (inositol monophosphatase family)
MRQEILDIRDFKKFMKLLIQKSNSIIRKYFQSQIAVEIKSDQTPVTIADKKVEEMMRELIMQHYPGHGILGEEFGNYQPEASYQWILDPIDGTKSFIHGMPTFGTLIALMKDNHPLIGTINLPILDKLLIGVNTKTELNGKIVRFRECSDLSSAVLLTTDHLHIEQYRNIAYFEKLMKQVKLYRTWGDCFGYYLLATGYADIMVDPIMSVWDTMALIPVIKGAGGSITDYYGKDPARGNSIVAANNQLHHQVISILNSGKSV